MWFRETNVSNKNICSERRIKKQQNKIKVCMLQDGDRRKIAQKNWQRMCTDWPVCFKHTAKRLACNPASISVYEAFDNCNWKSWYLAIQHCIFSKSDNVTRRKPCILSLHKLKRRRPYIPPYILCLAVWAPSSKAAFTVNPTRDAV